MNHETSMEKLWLFLAAAWPRLAEQYGDTNGPTFKVWSGVLLGDDVSAGLRRLMEEMPKWPPTLSEFRDHCRGVASLPKNDEEMRQWALDNGHGDARPRETWGQYRARLESKVHNETRPERLLT